MKRNLGFFVLLMVFGSSGHAFGEGDLVLAPEEIIRKAIAARGGEEALSKLLAHRDSLKGFMFHGGIKVPVKADILDRVSPPAVRMNLLINRPDGGVLAKSVIVFNGQKLWIKSNGFTREGSNVELEKERTVSLHISGIHLLFPLLDKHRYALSLLPPASINGKDCVGVRVCSQGYPDIHLYFNRKTWLPVKDECRFMDETQEQFYEGEKRLKSGIVFSARKTIVVNGIKQLELELLDVELLTEVKDSEFSKP